MDALDLTTGERLIGIKFLPKGSRRKASAPQRRQHTEEDTELDLIKEGGKSNLDSKMEELSDAETKSPINETLSPKFSENSDENHRNDDEMPNKSSPDRESTKIDDFASKSNNSDEILQNPSLQLQVNLNNNNSNSQPNSPEVRSFDADLGNFKPSSRSGHIDLSSFTPPSSSSFAMDDLMQQRLRRYLDDVQPAEAPGIPERTKKQNRWAFNVWREWARKRNMLEDSFSGLYKGVPLDVGQASEEELDYWLCKFVMEIRRKDGNPYPPHTLMQIVMGIQRYLRQQAGKPTICILDRSNSIYSNFRTVLDYRIKELTNNGATAMKALPRPALYNQNDSKYGRLLKSDVFESNERPERGGYDYKSRSMNPDTAQGLLNLVFWHNHKTFAIQYIDDHWNLRAENFRIHAAEQNKESEYLEFTPSATSMMFAAGKANGIPTTSKRIYRNNSGEKEIFSIYEKYLTHIPSNGPFYRHPVDPTIVDRSIKFSDQWVGKNRLRAMLKHLVDVGGGVVNRTKPFSSATILGRLNDSAIESYSTPLLRLSNHSPVFSASNLQNKIELIKPFLRIATPSEKESGQDPYLDNDSGPPSPKRIKTEASEKPGFTKPLRHSDERAPNRSSAPSAIEEGLEISVPQSIKSITVLKGGRKITFHLD